MYSRGDIAIVTPGSNARRNSLEAGEKDGEHVFVHWVEVRIGMGNEMRMCNFKGLEQSWVTYIYRYMIYLFKHSFGVGKCSGFCCYRCCLILSFKHSSVF